MASRVGTKKTFYSGQLKLIVRLLEGYHESPSQRQKQVRGCPHNAVYRVEISPIDMKNAQKAVQFVCPQAYLERGQGLDSLGMLRSSARAALGFAADEGFPAEEYAAFNDEGFHVGATPAHAWPARYRPRAALRVKGD